jgi:hypothetical protein
MFFSHIDRPMKFMVKELTADRPPSNVMEYMTGKKTGAVSPEKP